MCAVLIARMAVVLMPKTVASLRFLDEARRVFTDQADRGARYFHQLSHVGTATAIVVGDIDRTNPNVNRRHGVHVPSSGLNLPPDCRHFYAVVLCVEHLHPLRGACVTLIFLPVSPCIFDGTFYSMLCMYWDIPRTSLPRYRHECRLYEQRWYGNTTVRNTFQLQVRRYRVLLFER